MTEPKPSPRHPVLDKLELAIRTAKEYVEVYGGDIIEINATPYNRDDEIFIGIQSTERADKTNVVHDHVITVK